MKFLVALLCASVALVAADPSWNDLKVTWSINPLSSYAFARMPRDLYFGNMGFKQERSFCDGDKPKGPFAGYRFWKDNDPAVMLLFDKNDIIAGIQTAVPKDKWTANNVSLNHPVIDDGEYYVLTAYFVDPNIICSTGRSTDQFNHDGTGTGLYIQNGTNPLTDYIFIPSNEADVKQTKWTLGHCFYTMGNHYWYNVREDMPCDEFFPSCLLYNKGKLNAFCWAVNAKLDSPRYEHPTYDVIGKFINPVPQCFKTDPKYQDLSTMHVYFSNEIFDLC